MVGVARAQERTPGEIGRRKRCENCPALFVKHQPHQRFCSDNCRKEFHKYGGAFAKVRAEMEKQITKRIRDINPRDPETFAALIGRVQKLEGIVSAIRSALAEEHGI